MKKIIITVGGILLAVSMVSGILLGTFKDAAEDAANTAKGLIEDEIIDYDLSGN